MVKPYELRELLARVRSVLRRVPRADEAPAPRRRPPTSRAPHRPFGDFRADLDGRMVTGPGGAIVDMAKSEFDVLEVFLTRANRLLTRAAISEAIGLAEDAGNLARRRHPRHAAAQEDRGRSGESEIPAHRARRRLHLLAARRRPLTASAVALKLRMVDTQPPSTDPGDCRRRA